MLSLCLSLATVLSPPSADGFEPRVFGLELAVPEVEPAERFYAALGFARADALAGRGGLALRNADFHLVLVPSDAPAPAPHAASVTLNVRTGALERHARALVAAGGTASFDAPQRFPLGTYLEVVDPAGQRVHLLALDGEDDPTVAAHPRVFNVGLSVVDLARAEEVLGALGFAVLSRDYAPFALPFVQAGAAALVVHPDARAPFAAGTRGARLLLASDDLAKSAAALPAARFGASALGYAALLEGPDGLRLLLVDRSPARRAFERMARLAGRWTGKSTAGWDARIDCDLIAGGSVLAMSTYFEAHPEDTMMVLVHMDRGRLVLTHYCVAGNQPRLVATEIAPDASELVFGFLDATDLHSRDQGHMDRVVYRFTSDDAFTSRWTWFQQGSERWLEEIEYRRREPADATEAAAAPAGAPECHEE